ncbi:MAG: hypothetical protein U0264_02055 [Candidatus Kapaibacterium sp.]
MKNYLVFLAILLSNFSNSYSCGYSPYGEDIRFSLFLPEYFNYQDFSAFNYNSPSFGYRYYYQHQYESNVYDWYAFTKNQVALDEINTCLNTLTYTDIQSESSNQFVRYLYANKLVDVIAYLRTAKKCEEYNTSYFDDEWERNLQPVRDYRVFLVELQKLTLAEKSDYLKRKYAFLTIRAAYYGQDYALIHSLFTFYFAQGKKDYLYYWALYFDVFESTNRSVDIANIMAHSAEKKYAAYYYFHRQFTLEKALTESSTPADSAAVYAFASVQRLEPTLNYLKKIYYLNGKSRILDFLLLREMNKIEDWVYTPYYTNYLPSVEFASDRLNYEHADILSTHTLRARSEKDRIYAQQLLEFVQSVDPSTIIDAPLWKAAEIQLLFISRKYDACLRAVDAFTKRYAHEKIIPELEKIQALCIIAHQEAGKAIIKNEVKSCILKYIHDAHFIFAIGRELEYLNNLPDAVALLSVANGYGNDDYYEPIVNNSVEWQGNRLRTSGNLKYFYHYFEYLDFVYSAAEVKTVVNSLTSTKHDGFYNVIYHQVEHDEDQLKDLLGTKYIRENNLLAAQKAFASASKRYWEENYNAWERDKYDEYYMFEKNPFYDINYTQSFIPHEEKYVVTKLSVTNHLIKYLEKANNPKTENRDYYYFVIATCYMNMTQYGHSWMMRRFSSTTNYTEGNNESYTDEIEYRNGTLAQQYYHLAYDNAKTDKFKALCLRMEEYARYNIGSTYKELKSRYPQYSDDLSSCMNLEAYFKSRR